jgi:3-hydroxybutyryl-CoA dehydrogenase
MKIVVFGNDSSWDELTNGAKDIEWVRGKDVNAFEEIADTDAYFNLSEDACLQDYHKIQKPVFINSVSKTLKEIKAGHNVYRINGWTGFLKRTSWELSGKSTDDVIEITNALQKKIILVPDEPGFISARIIAMIINEAFFAKAENISTENEIDIAMKLGTNYPHGPFEWANEIGISNILDVLTVLSKTDARYSPCPLLQQKAITS